MNPQEHWEHVYGTKTPSGLSWFSPHLETSLGIIHRVAPDRSMSIIDVGGGESTLVDDLLASGYRNVAVVDISEIAIEHCKKRLGKLADQVTWIIADITKENLPERSYDVWHDRAVFHFLTLPEQRAAYVARAAASVKRNGHHIVGTFGPEGPTQCSGLDTAHYDEAALEREFGSQFRLAESQIEWHTTPAGGKQQFLYCLFQRVDRRTVNTKE